MSSRPSLEEALQRLGARRVEAVLVAALARAGSIGTRDLVERSGLRQPEVSVGMQALRSRGWVEAEAVPRAGKGRPMHRYRLTAPLKRVLAHYEAEGQRSIAAFTSAIEVARRHLGMDEGVAA
jgi:predicted transcriptional regulator